MDLLPKEQLLISINLISSTKEMNPIRRKMSIRDAAKFQSCRTNTRRMADVKNLKVYSSKAWVDSAVRLEWIQQIRVFWHASNF